MSWSTTNIMDQRMEFAVRAIHDDVNFAELCKEFGISRKTGYKWKERFRENGFSGLHDLSRCPLESSKKLSEDIICELIRLKNLHPKWGPEKIMVLHKRSHSNTPSLSSVKRILEKAGLTKKRKRRSQNCTGRIQSKKEATKPNEIWTVDFKGWWHGRDARCEPLTIRDQFSRYIISLDAMTTISTGPVKRRFEAAFRNYGLPEVIRSDNGTPFACHNSPLGLTKLSAWWLMLGIDLDRTRPGCPQDNGAHERMHRDIKLELQPFMKKATIAESQSAFDLWRDEFNTVRPHQSLNMRCPIDYYEKSGRSYPEELAEIDYPDELLVRKVRSSTGCIKIESTVVFLSTAFAGWTVGLKPLKSGQYEVWFANLQLATLDLPSHTVNWINPTPTDV